eukprot:3282859-Prymnesium_polylepis.1
MEARLWRQGGVVHGRISLSLSRRPWRRTVYLSNISTPTASIFRLYVRMCSARRSVCVHLACMSMCAASVCRVV